MAPCDTSQGMVAEHKDGNKKRSRKFPVPLLN